jgi:hypothetical protein
VGRGRGQGIDKAPARLRSPRTLYRECEAIGPPESPGLRLRASMRLITFLSATSAGAALMARPFISGSITSCNASSGA